MKGNKSSKGKEKKGQKEKDKKDKKGSLSVKGNVFNKSKEKWNSNKCKGNISKIK